MRFFITIALSAICSGFTPAFAEPQCGGKFDSFVSDLKGEAIANGHIQASVDGFFANVRQDAKTLKADRSQLVFQKSFIGFSNALISNNRLENGRLNAEKWNLLFERISQEYGINRGVLLAFWALETDFGAFQGDFNTLNSLVTLAHDCRRPELFRPQIFAALKLYEQGDFSPRKTKGAWAGEIGMVQMLPADILENGVDGDGDGKISLKTSPADALMSGAKMLSGLGWQPNQPWLQEISVPATLDWAKTGLKTELTVAQWTEMGIKTRSGEFMPKGTIASIILPMGHKGPAFIAYPNFQVYFEWNQSFVYVTTAAYFATRLNGAQPFKPGKPTPMLSGAQMKSLQQKLAALGYDVGKIDGILGAKTRAAVQIEQQRLGLPADAWPTIGLLKKL